ncbi:hypothetical protein ACLB6G_19780 [Zhengella sp. ZM62]|uniref:hypothetical protein n=1 Tax=Zhengella sedimenti TaxID=3390035 RepID=UPI0039755F36
MAIATKFMLAAGVLALSGCTHEAHQRNEGVSSYAGNAIAANTVMQMVDPWPASIEDTDLETPAERGTGEDGKPKAPPVSMVNAPNTTGF